MDTSQTNENAVTASSAKDAYARAIAEGSRFDLQDALLEALETLLDAQSAIEKKLKSITRSSTRVDLVRKRNRLRMAYYVLDGFSDALDQEPALGVYALLRDRTQQSR